MIIIFSSMSITIGFFLFNNRLFFTGKEDHHKTPIKTLMEYYDKPCFQMIGIDAGDPNSLIGDELYPNGNRINMGAYGGTDQASMSKNLTP